MIIKWRRAYLEAFRLVLFIAAKGLQARNGEVAFCLWLLYTCFLFQKLTLVHSVFFFISNRQARLAVVHIFMASNVEDTVLNNVVSLGNMLF